MSKIYLPKNQIDKVIRITPIRFSTKPFRAISITFKRPEPKTIALGGVATGSINAIEPDSVAGSIKSNGFISIDTDNPASMGKSISVVAVLEVNSVKKVIIKQIVAMMMIGW